MAKSTDIHPAAASLYFLPVEMRMPIKFGSATMTSVVCARVCMRVADARGKTAEGWGETPLSVGWVWPSSISYEEREATLKRFCEMLVDAWADFFYSGHPMEIGYEFQRRVLPRLLSKINGQRRKGTEPMPLLAALVCCSAFDIALHDAYGVFHQLPIYETYHAGFMNVDLAHFMRPTKGSKVSFKRKYPADFFVKSRPDRLLAWHLVGGKDPIGNSELNGSEPKDGYPVLLKDWIQCDGLKCLKIKLRGNDVEWDFARIVKIGQLAMEQNVSWLTADFNCTVTDPEYVNTILDRLMMDDPRIYGMILYVEQPFPYDLEAHQIDVHSVSARKPLFMDESAHDWHLIKLGRTLGWSGVALKTCKTQTGALLSLCWAKAHGMTLMVQDLTNPMLAQISHVLLAAYAGTIMGVETNTMQFYPAVSLPEEKVHPGIYQRRKGMIDLSSIRGPGFGYRLSEIERKLPAPSKEKSLPAVKRKKSS